MTEQELKVYIVDDDADLREALTRLLKREGISVEGFSSGEELLANSHSGMGGCILLDVAMPNMDGMELQKKLRQRGLTLPIIFLTGFGDVPLTVQAFRQGALDFLQKPIDTQLLLQRVKDAFGNEIKDKHLRARRIDLLEKGEKLSPREAEVLQHLVKGLSSKQIAKVLSISHRTVEVYRASIMDKAGSKAMSDLVALAQVMGLEDPL